MTPIKAQLQALRKQEGDSMRAMARKIECSPTLLALIESGRKTLSEDIRQKIVLRYKLTAQQEDELKIAAWASYNKCELDLRDFTYADRMAIYNTAKRIKQNGACYGEKSEV